MVAQVAMACAVRSASQFSATATAAAAVRPVGIEFGLKLELKFRLETLEIVETLGLETTAPGCFQR